MTDQVTLGEGQGNSTDATKTAADQAGADAATKAAADAAAAGGDQGKAAADKAASDAAAKATADAAVSSGDKWRETFATKEATVDGKLDQAAHDKLLARLKRFSTIDDAIKAFFNADKKIADGSYKKPLGDKATTEEIAEYRKANGIPETPDKYLDNLPNGLVIGEEDKPLIEGFAKALHGVHADPKTVHAAVDWYYKMQDEQEGLRAEANAAAKTATEDQLRDEMGPDYRANINILNKFISGAPQAVQEKLIQSSMPDGSQILNDPETVKWLIQQARELNYTGAVLPSGEASAKGLTGRLDEIRKVMRENRPAYNKDEKMQAEYRRLIDDQQRLEARKAG